MDIVQFVQSLYAAFARGDTEFIVAACDPGVIWVSNADPALFPAGGERRGRDGILSFFRELSVSIEIDSYEPLQFLGGPDFVVVLGRSISRSRQSGEPFEDDWLHLIKIRDGKVSEFRLFNDTHALVQAHTGDDIHSFSAAPPDAAPPLRR